MKELTVKNEISSNNIVTELDVLQDSITDFIQLTGYYAEIAKVPPANAAQHYVDIGSELGLPLHPFTLSSIDNLSGEKSTSPLHTNQLFDAPYCAVRMQIPACEALETAARKIARNEWIDFNPLLSHHDFLSSESTDLNTWIESLSDPKRSLVDISFNRFMPSYYRTTATQLTCDNELIDYILFGNRSGGIPHVFFDPWFTAQYDYQYQAPLTHPDLWRSVLSDIATFGRQTSPFYDPLECNHSIAVKGAIDPAEHPLDVYMSQTGQIIPPHPQVLPSSLAYAFCNRPIKECDPKLVSAHDVVHALEIALTGSRPAPKNVKLSICILNYNKPTHTILSSIAAAKNVADDVEILILDNGSNPKDWELIARTTQRWKNIRIIRSKKNLYFGEGNNVLADRTKGEYILFLNNDAYVGPKTVSAMQSHLESHPDTSACGVTFIFPDLSIQEAGGTISECGQQLQLKKNTSFTLHQRMTKNKSAEPTEYVSSACFCVRREVLLDLGGYDALFEPLYFEDTDLCRRITSAGYQIDHIPNEYVIHFENATTREFLGDRFTHQIERNRGRFRERWLYRPASYRPRTMLPAIGKTIVPSRKRAVIYTPYNIGIGGGERYILSVAATLAREFNVMIATQHMTSLTRISFAFSDLGINTDSEMIINTCTIDEAIAEGNCDLMIAMGNQVVPPIPLFGRRNIYHCQFPFPIHHEDRCGISRLESIDCYIVNSEYTKHHVEQQLDRYRSSCPVHVTFAPVKKQTQKNRTKSIGLRILNIGRFDPNGHSKRQDQVIEIFRRAYEKDKNISLTLVGGIDADEKKLAYVNSLRKRSENLPVTFLLNASREELENEISNSDIYLHSCGMDKDINSCPESQEHFGISVVEGMMAGLIPIVYDGGGPAEILRRTGVNNLYRSIDEAVSLVAKIAVMPLAERSNIESLLMQESLLYSDEQFATRVLAATNMVNNTIA